MESVPVHGSHFNTSGGVLKGPATRSTAAVLDAVRRRRADDFRVRGLGMKREVSQVCRAGLLVTLAGLTTAGSLRADGTAWQVDGGEVVVRCPLTIGGSFEATTDSLAGTLTAGGGSALEGELAVDLRTLDTGIGLRNRHLRENYLEVDRGEGFARAVLTAIALDGQDPGSAEGAARFTGTLLLHGTKKPVSGDARFRRAGDRVQVDATFPVRLQDFAIDEPRYLGVGVKDEVDVKVRFTAVSAAAGPETR